MKNNRLIITLPEGLRRALRNASKHMSCSQAEIIRISLHHYLKDFVEKDNKEEKLKILPNIFKEFLEGLSKNG